MIARPCIECGELIATGSRCTACRLPERPRPGRPSRPHAWRKLARKVVRAVGLCERCGTDGTEPNNPLTADHVRPVSLGGPMVPDPSGVRCLCKRCNSAVLAEQRMAAAATDSDPRGEAPNPEGGAHPGGRAGGDYSPEPGDPL